MIACRRFVSRPGGARAVLRLTGTPLPATRRRIDPSPISHHASASGCSRRSRMRTQYAVEDMTIHRIVEQELAFTLMREFLPNLTQELLDENRGWLEPSGLDPATGHIVFCFQSYVVKTPHHTVLVDSCIGNDKNYAQRPAWHRKSDPSWMNALKAAGVGVDDIDVVMCTHLHGDHVGWNTRLDNGRWV